MNYRQVETSREVRLWIKEIIVPAVIGSTILFTTYPELWVKTKYNVGQVAENLKSTIKKKETL